MQNRRRVLEGIVSSAKMEKTIVVKVKRETTNRLYQKTSISYKKFKAHDEEKKAKEGDMVRIIEGRPYSREKRFKLLAKVEKKFEILPFRNTMSLWAAPSCKV